MGLCSLQLLWSQDYSSISTFPFGALEVQTTYHPILWLHALRFLRGTFPLVVGYSSGDFSSLAHRPLCHLCTRLHWRLLTTSGASSMWSDLSLGDRTSSHWWISKRSKLVSGGGNRMNEMNLINGMDGISPDLISSHLWLSWCVTCL